MKIPFKKLLLIIGIAALAVPFIEVAIVNDSRETFSEFTNVSKGFMGVLSCGVVLFLLQAIRWFKKK